jgi:hypothetical protein
MRLLHPIRVMRLPGLPDSFEELAADALADGHKVLEVLRADWDSGALRFERPGEALFAAYAGSALLGVCGVTPDPYVQDEQTGRMRRLYVRRAARRAWSKRSTASASARAETSAWRAISAPASARRIPSSARCRARCAAGSQAA